MNHASLFSGLGGWDYAAECLGWQNLFHCEINDFCRGVLKYYWPESEAFTDITKTDFTKYANRIDVLSGSCPCQPFSVAGKRKGSKDDRNLWPSMHRAIKEIQPTWVCYENVPGLLTIERGLVFEQVCFDLENEGYEVTPFIIPACAKGAVHRRDRIWIVAYSDAAQQRRHEWQRENERDDGINSNVDVADTECKGLERRVRERGIASERNRGEVQRKNENWIEAATRLCGLDDGLAGRLEPFTVPSKKGTRKLTDKQGYGRWRIESLKAYGNAIYWPVAYEIFKAINEKG